MNTSLFLCGGIGLVVIIGLMLLPSLYRQKVIKPLQRSCEWQRTKAQKIGNGWIPPVYRDLKTDEEREQAIRYLLSDDGGQR